MTVDDRVTADAVPPVRAVPPAPPAALPARAVAVAVIAALVLPLSACGGGGGGEGPRPAPPGPTAPPGPSAPPLTPYEFYRARATAHGLEDALACSEVRWDDSRCGEDLTAAGRTAGAVARYVEKRFAAGEYAGVREAADSVVAAVNTAREFGCFGTGSRPPGEDRAEGGELCATMVGYASLAWLGFTGAVEQEGR